METDTPNTKGTCEVCKHARNVEEDEVKEEPNSPKNEGY